MPHYCKICQTYKANEKFSGKGHKSHICKVCKGKPLPKKEKPINPTKNPFMKAIKIIEVISFEYDPRMIILFKRGSGEFVAFCNDDEPYQIFEFIRKEERFERTSIFDDKEMAIAAIEKKSNFASIHVAEWDDFERVLERIEAYEQQTIELDGEHDLSEGSFVEHYYKVAREHEKLILHNLYKIQNQLEETD